jgi:hypothetical protein
MKKVIPLILTILIGCSEQTQRSNDPGLAAKPVAEPTSQKHVNIVSPSGELLYDYMNHPALDARVKAYLEGNLDPHNNSETRELLDVLVKPEGELTSLYFGVFNKICKEANEELSAILGSYAMKLLENQTEFCVASLKNGAPDYFTGHISNAMYTEEGWENTLKIYSSKLYDKINDNPELIMELNHLMEGIKNDIHHLSDEP